ncbi:MAG: hypothetical protein WCV73_01430 [Patescibacteria group bacterium]|jgi:hypothetical protein
MDQPTHKREIKYSSDDGHPWEADSHAPLQPNTPAVAKGGANNWGEFVYSRSLAWYKEVAAWPMFILLLLEIALRVIQTKYFPLAEPLLFNQLINITRVIIFAYLSYSALKNYSATKQQTLVASVLGGLVAGVILAVFQLIWYFELWAFFNLIGQPLLLAAEGLMISWFFTALFFRKIIK